MNYSLETPCCGAAVFLRPDNMFFNDESERCPDCGDLATVNVEEGQLWISMAEEPPDNWPHPWSATPCAEIARSPASTPMLARAGAKIVYAYEVPAC